MAKSNSNANTLNIKTICMYDVTIAPLNQMKQYLNMGYYIPLIKQGVDSNAPHLTKREKSCLKLFLEGLPIKVIADDFGISERSVRLTLKALRDKFKADTNNRLIASIYKMGLHAVL